MSNNIDACGLELSPESLRDCLSKPAKKKEIHDFHAGDCLSFRVKSNSKKAQLNQGPSDNLKALLIQLKIHTNKLSLIVYKGSFCMCFL